jgi:predicted hotdog family 3-hydroxylacyl-ACP dehydratase
MREIGRAEILRMIPHAGEMCLLDAVMFWDARFLRGRSTRSGSAGNPLRRADGSLGMACLIELAGQAMAAHGRLLAGDDGPPRPGMLVSLRDVALSAGPLEAQEIQVEVERLAGDARGAAYGFRVSNAARTLLAGRATVLLSGAA